MNEQTRDDLAFMRDMAEAGSSAPLLGGRFFVFFGTLIPLAYAGQWMVLDGRFGLPPVTIAFIWIAFGIAIAVGMPLLLRSLKRKPGRGAAGNKAEAASWMIAGFTIGIFFAGILFGTATGQVSVVAFDYILAVAFTGYGIALYTTASLSGARWLKTPAYMAMASVGVIPILAGRPEVYLFGAAAVIAVSLVPGIRLLLAEPKSLPEEA
ncbi:hypothetical protein HK107_05655 [Parvularcula sp. ZS-1/3]|uniref:Uncharacterized protein n=1 Tax=Parvularcula mediterranea TaxID=2732508 RepID=A0A7Y3RKR4_9PROT|nr:hypothetical protein [Parvularcula mediterranea]NNU15805.1 hypothetical protein [Parvularcula mediterranea]